MQEGDQEQAMECFSIDESGYTGFDLLNLANMHRQGNSTSAGDFDHDLGDFLLHFHPRRQATNSLGRRR